MIVEEKRVLLPPYDKDESSDSSGCDYAYVHDSVYKKKLSNLLHEIFNNKESAVLVQLPDGHIEEFSWKIHRICHNWSGNNTRFVRSRSNHRNSQKKALEDEVV